MPEKSKRERYSEWACRILLTVHCWLTLSGYIAYLQAKHQLISPLIPEDTIRVLTEPNFYTGLCMGATFLLSIWFYFFRKKLITIIMSSISVLAYEPVLLYFTT